MGKEKDSESLFHSNNQIKDSVVIRDRVANAKESSETLEVSIVIYM